MILKVKANLMYSYDGATCLIDYDPSDVLSQKYKIETLEEKVDSLKSNPKNLVFGAEGKIKIEVAAGKVSVYSTNGMLVKQQEINHGNREIILASGIYFVRVEADGISQTEKVFVYP